MVDTRVKRSVSVTCAEPDPVKTRIRSPRRVTIDCSEPKITKQSHKDDVDRNVIIARYLKGAPLPQGHLKPLFIDAPIGVNSFQDAYERIGVASELFSDLPSKVRSRFNNDPMFFADFAVDPKNRDELVKLGLADALADPAAQRGQQPVPSVDSPKASGDPAKPKVDAGGT